MNAQLLEQIAEAVLYEGYILYPYRASSKKNQRERFTFGRVYPEAYSISENGAEPFLMQTECLLKVTSESPQLKVSVRFLQPVSREIGEFETPVAWLPNGTKPGFKTVPELRVGDQLFQAWHEAIERTVTVPAMGLGIESFVTTQSEFHFTGSCDTEAIRDGQLAVGIISRRQETLEGTVEVRVQCLEPRLRKVTVRVANHTPIKQPELNDQEHVLMRTFASTHAVLSVENGEFLSLMDPPPEARNASANCMNIGTWPVLVGDETRNERDAMLSSPIILYDYPKIAGESAGPLFDGTEIDEILTLRIQTMTEQEKLEVRHVDEHVRRLLERTEALPKDAVLRMHGTMRESDTKPPVEYDDFFGASTRLKGVTVQGVFLRAGDRVRIRPKARADLIDMALSGQVAVIETIEQDLEQRVHVAVVLENDPGKDLGLMRQPGHRFFYGPDEVEPVKEGAK